MLIIEQIKTFNRIKICYNISKKGGAKMSVRESQKKARDKWNKKNMATLGCSLRKEHAKQQGTTANALLKEYILETIQEDKEKEQV